MLVLPRPAVCGELALEAYARACHLTPSELRVLRALGDGLSPAEIARAHGVAVSTVRTQVSSLRAKTGSPNLRALTRKLATLPPYVGVLGRLLPRLAGGGLTESLLR